LQPDEPFRFVAKVGELREIENDGERLSFSYWPDPLTGHPA